MTKAKRLYKSEDDKLLLGIAGGIAKYLNIDPVWIRLAFIILALIQGFGVLLYIIFWIIMPNEPIGKKTKNVLSNQEEKKACKSRIWKMLLWTGIILLIFLVLFPLIIGGIILAAFHSQDSSPREINTYNHTVQAVSNLKRLNVDISYGAGELYITNGSEKNFLYADIKTADTRKPNIYFEIHGREGNIDLNRKGTGISRGSEDQWNLYITPEKPIELDLDYGAVRATIDLRNLNIDELRIDSGATKTEVQFGKFPTKASIDTGASAYTLYFPEDMSVRIEANCGLSEIKLSEFTQDENFFYSPSYDYNKDTIELEINCGLSYIESMFI
jgi:phage shock protein C